MSANLNLSVIFPELVLVIFAMLVMIVDVFSGDERSSGRDFLPWVALLGVAVAGIVCVQQYSQPVVSFQGAAISDHFALGLRLVILVATALGILLSVNYIPQVNRQVGEYYALLLL